MRSLPVEKDQGKSYIYPHPSRRAYPLGTFLLTVTSAISQNRHARNALRLAGNVQATEID